MITGFTVSNVEGKIESVEALSKQRFPKINVNLEEVKSSKDGVTVKYSFLADYFDGDSKDAKSVGQLNHVQNHRLIFPKHSSTEKLYQNSEKMILLSKPGNAKEKRISNRTSSTSHSNANRLLCAGQITISQDRRRRKSAISDESVRH